MSLVLCLDCATPAAVLGLVRDGGLCAERFIRERQEHAERMYGVIEELLSEAGSALTELDAIAVGLGPGSFIGVRVAVATAKGLAIGAGIPLVGVSTLAALALACGRPGIVAVGLDAKKGQLYGAVYQVAPDRGGAVELMAPAALDPAPCAERFAAHAPLAALVGDGVQRYAQAFAQIQAERVLQEPSALALHTLARDRIGAEQWDDADALVPCYVRRSEAEEKRDAAGPAIG